MKEKQLEDLIDRIQAVFNRNYEMMSSVDRDYKRGACSLIECLEASVSVLRSNQEIVWGQLSDYFLEQEESAKKHFDATK